jgi:hypothetical protein
MEAELVIEDRSVRWRVVRKEVKQVRSWMMTPMVPSVPDLFDKLMRWFRGTSAGDLQTTSPEFDLLNMLTHIIGACLASTATTSHFQSEPSIFFVHNSTMNIAFRALYRRNASNTLRRFWIAISKLQGRVKSSFFEPTWRSGTRGLKVNSGVASTVVSR